jgi:hypothetical protein
MTKILFLMFLIFYSNPSSFKEAVDEEIKRKHREIIEEVFKWYCEKSSIPQTVTTPNSHWVVQYNWSGC